MAPLARPTFLLTLLVTLVVATRLETGSADNGGARFSVADALEWSAGTVYDEFGDGGLTLALEEGGGAEEEEEEEARRSLFWRAARYYISYGALSANRVPCPPRSGRSYYTHNCFRASGPVRPYFRGCSAITHCRR